MATRLLLSAVLLAAGACLQDDQSSEADAQPTRVQACDGSACPDGARSDADVGEDDAGNKSPAPGCEDDAGACVDADGDGVAAEAYGGLDCDDKDPRRFRGNVEVCDYAGHDEDCDLTSVAGDPSTDSLADKDHDGAIDIRCVNLDPETSREYPLDRSEMDCDDAVDEIYPRAGEDCDGTDNDCDGYIDELPSDDTGVHESFGAQSYYCRDADGDSWSTQSDRIRRCGAPTGYIPCRFDQASDCNDRDERVYPSALEVCDGLDNNCDGVWEGHGENADALFGRPMTKNDATLDCVDGAWKIVDCPPNRLWCDTTTIARGCEIDAMRLRSCGSCETQCSFACGGASGCDEVAKLALGSDFACALTRGGHAACWGRGVDGRLGNDDVRGFSIPQPVNGVDEASDIATGGAHTCIISGPDRAVYCWGNNGSGQLGDPDSAEFSAAPVPVVGTDSTQLTGAERIAVGRTHSCALISGGLVVCWGSAEAGRLGNKQQETASPSPVPVVRDLLDPTFGLIGALVADAVELAVGMDHSCIVNSAGEAECWGSNAYGQLGLASDTADSAMPVVVPGLGNVFKIAAGDHHTCAISAGEVYCWGDNVLQQLGRPTGEGDFGPAVVVGLRDVVNIAAGEAVTCATTADGALYCWGSNRSGELGKNEATSSSEPVLMPAVNASDVFLGGAFACIRTREAAIECWGNNIYGQLGRGFASLGLELKATKIQPLQGSKP